MSEDTKLESNITESSGSLDPLHESPKEVPIESKPTEIESDSPKGFISKDRWVELGRDVKDWREPKDYIDRGQLIGTVKSLQEQLQEQSKLVQQLAKHTEEVKIASFNAAYQKARQDLSDATILGDINKVQDITDKLVKMNEEHKASAVVVSEDEGMKAAKDFVEKNKSWYHAGTSKNLAMVAFAQGEETALKMARPDLRPAQVLELVEQKVKKEFSTMFYNEEREAPPTVGRSDGAPSSGKETKFEDLKPHQRTMWNAIKKAYPNKDIKEYINELKLYGDI